MILQNQFELILQTIPDGIMAVNRQGKIIFVNESLLRILGRSNDELINAHYAEFRDQYALWNEQLCPIDDWPITAALQTLQETKDVKYMVRSTNGDIYPVSINVVPFYDGGSNFSGVVVTFRDNSQYERTADHLAQQLQESQALYEISQALAGTIDLSATLQQIADAATRLIKSADQTILHLLNEQQDYLQAVSVSGKGNPNRRQRMNFKWGEGIAGLVLATGQTINVDDVLQDTRYIVLDDQSVKFRSLMVAPIKTRDKNLGTLSVHSPLPGAYSEEDERLLTTLGIQAAVAIEKAVLYADLQASLQQEKATRTQLVQGEKLAALGRIVASVAHELNNPLQAIQNALYLIQLEESLSAQTREDLQTVLNETNRMADLIARLRETYRPTVQEQFKPEALNDLVIEVQKLLSTHLRHANVVLEFRPSADLPPVSIIRDQIKQVIMNISLNAVEAMPLGGALIIETKYIKDANFDGAHLIISDTGTSISPEILPYIFDPFVTTKDGGTGLGLAISYDIVRRHNGRIEVESEAGKGSTFRIWLPQQYTDLSEVQTGQPEISISKLTRT